MLGLGARGDKDFSRYLKDTWAPPTNKQDDDFTIPFGVADIKKPGKEDFATELRDVLARAAAESPFSPPTFLSQPGAPGLIAPPPGPPAGLLH